MNTGGREKAFILKFAAFWLPEGEQGRIVYVA
jgi:hypothetical protein